MDFSLEHKEQENSMTRIAIEDAQKLVFQEGIPVETEYCPVSECAGRVLAEDLTSAIPQPPFARSAMDGYALREADIKGACQEQPVILKVIYKTCAGDPPGRRLLPGECVRIMTGAVLPEGADCVIRQEDTDEGESRVRIYSGGRAQQNCCAAGEDFKPGDILARAGDRMDAYIAAAAVAAGRRELLVRRRLRAAIVTTGEELAEAGSALLPGKIYNSNLTYLQVRLVQEGCEVVYCRRTGDERSVIAAAVREAVKTADFVVTTGGVSVGQKDQLPYVMEELGARILFRGISLKPGMPSMGAVLEKTPVLCLSGNPYSAFAVFELLIRPLKAGFLGCTEYHYTRVQTIAASGFSKPSKTRRLLRGCYDGRSVSLSGKQQNGQLTGGIGCNCLVDIPADSEAVQSGDVVEIILMGQQ